MATKVWNLQLTSADVAIISAIQFCFNFGTGLIVNRSAIDNAISITELRALPSVQTCDHEGLWCLSNNCAWSDPRSLSVTLLPRIFLPTVLESTIIIDELRVLD